MRVRIVAPAEYIGNIQKLAHERRATFKSMSYLDKERVELDYELPLAEIVLDVYDRIKSSTRGYAALARTRRSVVAASTTIHGTPIFRPVTRW